MDSSLTLPVTLQDCCPLASTTVVWGNWHIFLILWCGFGEGKHSRPQLYIQGNTQEVEIMPGYSKKKKKKIKPGLIFALWNDPFWLYLCLPTSVSYTIHASPPSWLLFFINAISWWKGEENVAVVDCQGKQLPLPFST